MRRTKEDAEKTRAAILLAAEVLFLEKGVAHTTLEQIARHAGVTRGAVYWHFRNKADLFHAMVSQVRLPPEQLTERLRSCDREQPLRPLRDLCIEAIENLARAEQRRRIFTILLHRCEFTDELREAEERHNAFIASFIELSEQLFECVHRQGQLHPGVTPHQAAQALHGLILGLFSDWTRDPSQFDPLSDTSSLIDALFRGLVRGWNPAADAQATATS